MGALIFVILFVIIAGVAYSFVGYLEKQQEERRKRLAEIRSKGQGSSDLLLLPTERLSVS